MLKVVASCWPLFFGIGLIMLGNGLQGSLLGVRATLEGFSVSVTGIVMSGYFVGLLLGSWLVPPIVARVGHIRSFGALASLASTSILVHVIFVDPAVWWVMRVMTGISFAGLYIVAESWLNDAAENETRGQLLSFYMLVTLGGLSGGQFLLNIASPSGFELFVLISVLVSLAVIPILISVSPAPTLETTENVSLLQLYKVSPLGVFGITVSGCAMGAIFGLGSVVASKSGLSVKEVSFYMGAIVLGGAVLQYPIGRLSDVIGRRRIIIIVCIICAGVSVLASNFTEAGWQLYAMVALLGGFAMPLYSLFVAYTNDYLSPSQMVAASGTLVLASGIGAALGSPLTAFAMDYVGPKAFYYAISVFMGTVAVFGLWRATQRPAMSTEEAGDFVVMAPTPISAAFNPDLDLEEIEAASDVAAQEVQASFEELVQDLESPEEDPASPT